MIKPIRKLWRLLGLIFPILYLFIDRLWIIGIIAVVLIGLIGFESYRLKHRDFNRRFFKKYSFLLKPSEKEKITSATWFMLASLVVVLFFDKDIAILSIFFAGLGNVAAVFAGLLYGKFTMGYKNVEGSFAMLIVCVIVGLVAFFAGFVELGLMLVGAFAATLTELFTPGSYDNFTVAVLAAIVMSLV